MDLQIYEFILRGTWTSALKFMTVHSIVKMFHFGPKCVTELTQLQFERFCSRRKTCRTSGVWAGFPAAAAALWCVVVSGEKVAIIPDIPLVASQPPRLSPAEEGNEKVKRRDDTQSSSSTNTHKLGFSWYGIFLSLWFDLSVVTKDEMDFKDGERQCWTPNAV